MKAFVIQKQNSAGAVSELVAMEREAPAPGPFEVSVRVHAAGLNRADLLQLRGHYPAPPGAPADIPGLEYSGEVISAGTHVSAHRPGDRVMGIVGGGAFSEQLVVHEREALRVPADLPLDQAAAFPEAFLTAWDALVLQGGMKSGAQVLIHAVGSGVGTAAVQVVQALGATALGTARGASKLERLKSDYQLAHGILVADDPVRFADQVRSLTGGVGVDVCLDLVGGAYTAESVHALAPRGRLLLVGLLAGAQATVDLRAVLSRRLRLIGTVLRSRPIEEKLALAQAAQAQLVPLLAKGVLRPVIDAVMPFSQLPAALERMRTNASFGKIVLRW